MMIQLINKMMDNKKSCRLVLAIFLFIFLVNYSFFVHATYLPGAATTLTGLSDINTATATYGSLFVADGTDWESVTAPLFVDTVSGRVGVGTTFPQKSLELASVGGTGDTNPTEMRIYNATEQGSSILEFAEASGANTDGFRIKYFSNASGTLNKLEFIGYMGDGVGTKLMNINRTSGFVGIGNTAPDDKLDVVGNIDVTGTLKIGGSAISLTGLSDVTSDTATAGRILVADGTDFESVAISGDATLGSDGTITIANNSVDGTDIALGSDAQGDVMYYDGTDWARLGAGTDGQFLKTQGAGADPVWASAGSSSLTGLSDVNTATATAGRILVSDGTDFESMALTVADTRYGSKVIVVDGTIYAATDVGIQAAISALPASGGEVFLPEGTYNLAAAITLPSNVTIRGAGYSTILYLSNGSNSNVMENSDAGGGNTNINIKDLKIDGNDAGNTGTCNGIYFSIVSDSNISGVWIYDVEDLGIRTDNSSQNIIKNNKFTSIATYAIYVASSNESIIENNFIVSNASVGIVMSGTSNICNSNLIKSNSGGLTVMGSYHSISNNEIVSNTNQGILVGNGAGVGANYCNITNNTLYNNTGATTSNNIDVNSNSDGNVINSNTIIDTAGTGDAIEIDSNCDNNVIFGNYYSGTGATNIDNQNATTVIMDVLHQGSGDILNLFDDGVEIFSIINGGKVGIGVSVPDDELDVLGSIDVTGSYKINGSAFSLTGLSDVTSATATAGRILVADGTDFESVAVSGDCTLASDGSLSCSAGATTLTGLTDVNTATATRGSILVADGTDWESVTAPLFVNTINNRIGIGTTAPDATLTVEGDTHFQAGPTWAGFRVALASSGTTLIAHAGSSAGSGKLWFNTSSNTGNGTTKMFISDTGLVGVGTTGPAVRFHTLAADDATIARFQNVSLGHIDITPKGGGLSDEAPMIKFVDSDDSTTMTISAAAGSNNSAVIYSESNILLKTGTADAWGGIGFDGGNDPTAKFEIDGNAGTIDLFKVSSDADNATQGNLFAIKNSGYVGIGITNPNDTLDVVGNIDLTGTLKIGGTAISLTGLSDVNSDTATAGRILVADGTDFESVAVSGDCTLASDGSLSCSAAGATTLTGLTDVNTATATRGSILVADGTDWESVTAPLFVDLTNSRVGVGTTTPLFYIHNAGNMGIGQIFARQTPSQLDAISNVPVVINHSFSLGYSGIINGVLTGGDSSRGVIHAGMHDSGGADFSKDWYSMISARMGGSSWDSNPGALSRGYYLPGIGFAGQSNTTSGTGMELAASIQGLIDGAVSSGVLPTALVFHTSQTDNSGLLERVRITSSGNVGIGETNPDDALDVVGNIDVTGTLKIGGTAISLTGLSDVNSDTATAGRILVADGTDFESVAVSGDCTLASDGTITCSSATSLTGLSDVNTATATRGAILVADGTDWESVTAPLFVDTVNGRVGVGVTDPGESLEINNTIMFTSEYDNGNSGTDLTIDWGNGNKQKVTLTGNCTFTFTAPNGGVGNFLVKIVQDGTGSRTITWPASVLWPGGTAPTLTTTAAAVDFVSLYFDGTNYYAVGNLDFK